MSVGQSPVPILEDDWEALAPPAEFAARAAPRIDTEPVPLCPVCQSSDYSLFAVGFDYELLTCSNPWRFVRCQECRHVWLNPRPAIATLATIYPPTYYAYNYEARVSSIARHGKALLDSFKLRGILKKLPRMPESYLDIGCGSGRFLRAMHKKGLKPERIFGMELDPDVVAKLNQAGFRAFCERVETCSQIPNASLDLVTMFHVIEHVDDPGQIVNRVVDWLAPGGVFAVETPNLRSLDARMFRGRHWGGYHIPRHWNLFSVRTLARLLTDRGLEIVGVKYQTGHSFWMYSLHHRLRYARRPWKRLSRWFDPLTGLPFLVLFTGFDRLRASLGFKTSSMLMLARKP